MSWDPPTPITDPNDRTDEYFNKFSACFELLSQHRHTGVAGDGAALTGRYNARAYHQPARFIKPGATFQYYSYSEGEWGGYIESNTYLAEVTYEVTRNMGNIILVHGQGWGYGRISVSVNGLYLYNIDCELSPPEVFSDDYITTSTINHYNLIQPGALGTLRFVIEYLGPAVSGYKSRIYGLLLT